MRRAVELDPESPSGPVPGARALGGLAEILSQEARGLEEFEAVLGRQRGAVAAADRPELEESIEDIERLLLLLGRLREQRVAMISGLGAGTERGLARLEELLGGELPAPVRHARRRLRRAAEQAAHAAAVNRTVLRRVLESEQVFLQSLFAEAPVGYSSDAGSTPVASVLLDRRG